MLLLIAICLDLGAWEWLVFALVLSGIANALIGIYEYFGGSGALHLLIDGVHFRAFGTFGQPNPFGGFMGLLAPVALMAAIGYGYRLWRGWRAEHHLSETGACRHPLLRRRLRPALHRHLLLVESRIVARLCRRAGRDAVRPAAQMVVRRQRCRRPRRDRRTALDQRTVCPHRSSPASRAPLTRSSPSATCAA